MRERGAPAVAHQSDERTAPDVVERARRGADHQHHGGGGHDMVADAHSSREKGPTEAAETPLDGGGDVVAAASDLRGNDEMTEGKAAAAACVLQGAGNDVKHPEEGTPKTTPDDVEFADIFDGDCRHLAWRDAIKRLQFSPQLPQPPP